MLFSAVILSFNSERTLDKCLKELRETFSQYDQPSEIFVIENGSKDRSPEILRRHEEEDPSVIKPFYLEENTGTTVSRNMGLNAATGQYILVLDSDAYMSKNNLDKLRSTLDSNPSIGMAVPKLFYGDGRFQMSTDTFPTLVRKAQRFLSLDKMQDSIHHESLTNTDVDYAISACWLIKKEAVDKTPGFDENIFYSPEDVDFCIQIWKAGYRIHYVSDTTVVHDAQELSRGFRFSFFHFSHLGGLFYLFKKYGYFFGLKRLYKKIGRH